MPQPAVKFSLGFSGVLLQQFTTQGKTPVFALSRVSALRPLLSLLSPVSSPLRGNSELVLKWGQLAIGQTRKH